MTSNFTFSEVDLHKTAPLRRKHLQLRRILVDFYVFREMFSNVILSVLTPLFLSPFSTLLPHYLPFCVCMCVYEKGTCQAKVYEFTDIAVVLIKQTAAKKAHYIFLICLKGGRVLSHTNTHFLSLYFTNTHTHTC